MIIANTLLILCGAIEFCGALNFVDTAKPIKKVAVVGAGISGMSISSSECCSIETRISHGLHHCDWIYREERLNMFLP